MPTTLNKLDTNNVTFLVTDSGTRGYWAKGSTLAEAARNLKRFGAKPGSLLTVWIVANDPNAVINEWGAPRYGGADAPDAWVLPAFGAGTLQSVLKSNSDRL